MNKKTLTAPCGLDCFNCPIYEGNITEEDKKQISESLKIPVEEAPCKGCRAEQGRCKFALNKECATWNCVQQQGVSFCYECHCFPCELLMPSKQGAQFPHNMKVYNLCRMRCNGHDAWIDESAIIRKRYYEGKYAAGKGPSIEDK